MPAPAKRPAEDIDEDPIFEDRSKPFLIRTLVILAIVGSLGILVRPVLNTLRDRGGQSAVASAIEAIRNKRPFGEAEAVVRQAVAAAPGNAELLRLASQWATTQARPEGLAWWRQLLALPEASREDRFRFVESMLTANRLDLTGPELSTMFRFDPSDPQTLRLLIRHHQQNDDLVAAISTARHGVTRHPGDEELRLSLGRLLLQHSAPAARAEGRLVLQSLIIREGPFHDDAVNTLADDRELSAADRDAIIKAVDSRSGKGSIVDRLRVATLKIRANPGYQPQAIADVVLASRGNASITNLVALGKWLSGLGENERLLEVIPFDKARLDSTLMSLHLGALGALNRWQDIEPSLKSASSSLDPAHNHLLLAAVAFRQGRKPDAEQAFELAIRASAGDAQKLILVANQAERLGVVSAAVHANEIRAGIPGNSGSAAAEIIRLAGAMTDTRTALEALRRATQAMPNSVPLALEEAYLRILGNDGLAETRAQLALLAAQNPASREIRLTQAIAELQAKNIASAQSLIEAEPLSWNAAPTRWRLIHAAILGTAGDIEGARQWARQIDLAKLKKEEADLIRSWSR